MPGEKEFLSKTYHIKEYKPSTQLGNFDAVLAPQQGKLFITVRMAFFYTSMYFGLAFPDIQKTPNGHDLLVIESFFDKAMKIVPMVWNNKFKFILEKEDWSQIEIIPEFRIEKSSLEDAHYDVELSDSSSQWMNSAVVTEGPRNKKVKAHFATFSNDVIGTSGFEYKIEDVVKELVKGHSIPFPNYKPDPKNKMKSKVESARLLDELLYTEEEGTIWGQEEYGKWKREKREQLVEYTHMPEIDENMSKKRLEYFLDQFRKLTVNINPKKFQLKIILRAPINRYGSLIEYVFRYLNSQEKMIMKIEHQFSPFGSEERSIFISLLSSEVKSEDEKLHVKRIVQILIKDSIFSSINFTQITIAHEFGHMLGLPDEYICLTKKSSDLMKNMDFNLVRSSFIVEKWLEFQNPETGIKRDNPITSKNQHDFILLCTEAGIQTPMFGRKTSSLMSAGSDFMIWHAITLWECLAMLTSKYNEPNEWKITLI